MQTKRQELIHALFKDMDCFVRLVQAHKRQEPDKGMPTHAQLSILFTLQHQGAQSIKEIAEYFNMSSSAATQLVDGLAKEDLLAREEDHDDRRKISVVLTAKGKQKLLLAKKLRLKRVARMYEPLTDEELAQMYVIQKKIVEHMNNLWNQKSHPTK